MSKQAKREAELRMTKELYRVMPGAPTLPTSRDGLYMWGEVEGNDHWQFCERIASLIVRNSALTFVEAD